MNRLPKTLGFVFTLSALKDEARMREYDSSFFWLDDAKLVNICFICFQSNLFFYNNYDKDEAANRMQIDFLIQKGIVTSRHNISPIEVKSSTNYTLTSIKKCIKKFGQYLSTPYVLHTNDVEQKDGLVYLPLYMTPLL